MFDHIDINDFWDSSSENNHHKLEPFSEEDLREIQQKIGYILPESYIALLRVQNGGSPKNIQVGDTAWEIDEFYGISKDDSDFWKNEGEFYPKIGVPICTTSDDSSIIFLDYRSCRNDGEPKVVGVDLELNVIDFIAKDFESFIHMLVSANDEDDEDDNENVGDKFDPYEGAQFTPVEGAQRKKLNRVIWGDLPWAVGFAAFWLLIIFLLHFIKANIIVALLMILFCFPAGYGILGTIAGLIDCISKSRQTYESYVDTVDAVWELNEPINRAKSDEGKRKKIFLCLKISKATSYENTDRFQEGDRVRVYRAKNGKVILAKEQE